MWKNLSVPRRLFPGSPSGCFPRIASRDISLPRFWTFMTLQPILSEILDVLPFPLFAFYIIWCRKGKLRIKVYVCVAGGENNSSISLKQMRGSFLHYVPARSNNQVYLWYTPESFIPCRTMSDIVLRSYIILQCLSYLPGPAAWFTFDVFTQVFPADAGPGAVSSSVSEEKFSISPTKYSILPSIKY